MKCIKSISLVMAMTLCASPVFAGYTTFQPKPYANEMLNQTLSNVFSVEENAIVEAAAQAFENAQIFAQQAYRAAGVLGTFINNHFVISNQSIVMRALRVAALAGLVYFRHSLLSHPVISAALKVVAAAKLINSIANLED